MSEAWFGGAAVTPFGASIVGSIDARAARAVLQAATAKYTAPLALEDRKTGWAYCFANPLALVPTNIGVGEPPALQDSLGRQALSEGFIRRHVAALQALGVKVIVIGQLEFGGYHWIRPPSGQVWPDRLAPATGKPVWYWDLIGGDKTAYADVDVLAVILDEARRREMGVIVGTSRHDDVNWLNDFYKVLYGLRPNSTLTVTPGVTGSQTFTTNFDTFIGDNLNWTIVPETGPGRAVITGVTDARTVTVNVTEAFATASHTSLNWRLRWNDPLAFGMTIQQRSERAVEAQRQLISWVHERFGTNPALLGFYLAHEPDHLESGAEAARRVWAESGAYPSLSSYTRADGRRYEWMISPASPIDLFSTDIGRIRDALRLSGVSILAEQDGVGAGTDRLTGTYNWIAGQATTLAQMYDAHKAYQVLLAGTGVTLVGHMEVWEMDGTLGYSGGYPANPVRLQSQWEASQALPRHAMLYQSFGFINPADDPIQPPVSTTFCPDFRARANALYSGLLAQAQDRARKGYVYSRSTVRTLQGRRSYTSFGGDVTTLLATYQPQAQSSELRVEVFVALNRTGGAGSATGYIDASVIVGSTESAATRTLRDDDRSSEVTFDIDAPARNQPVNLSLRLNNWLIAPTGAEVVVFWRITETV